MDIVNENTYSFTQEPDSQLPATLDRVKVVHDKPLTDLSLAIEDSFWDAESQAAVEEAIDGFLAADAGPSLPRSLYLFSRHLIRAVGNSDRPRVPSNWEARFKKHGIKGARTLRKSTKAELSPKEAIVEVIMRDSKFKNKLDNPFLREVVKKAFADAEAERQARLVKRQAAQYVS